MVKQKKLLGALKKLHFTKRSGGKEQFYYFELPDGTITSTVLVQKTRGDIPSGTMNKIRKQMHLNHNDFEGAIACPFKYDDYLKVILDKELD